MKILLIEDNLTIIKGLKYNLEINDFVVMVANSIKDAKKHYKCNNISACCRGKCKHSGELNGVKLQWKYLEDYNNEFKGILINPIIE